MLGPANPFKEIAGTIPLDGRGPNPLLQNHPLVAIHPPMLYLGYVGFTIPFSFAVAALITGRFGEGWLADVRRTTLVAWGFLTIGIVLGAWWSYEVLGWGGYWGWDPVENASLLPWLTGTAFIHSVMVQERRGMLRVWNLSLVLATFCLTILGTFLTRSGVVDVGAQLHAVADRSVAADVPRRRARSDASRSSPGAVMRCDRPVASTRRCRANPRSSLNNLLFAALRAGRADRDRVPAARRGAAGSTSSSVGEPYFERLGVPIGIALLFLMAVGPLLPWRARERRTAAQAPARSRRGAAAITLVVALDARRARRRAGVDVLARRVRLREHRPHDRHRRARPPARALGSGSGRGCAHGPRATRGCTAGSSSTSASSSSRSRSRRRPATSRGAR